jgi:MoCo/4Fe-4S cofactor protein with predicted Tat translocation signal
MSKRSEYEFGAPQDAAPIFWKSLESKASPDDFAARATAEFPREVSQLLDKGEGGFGRRGFLFGGLATAMLAVEGCARRPTEKILPYTRAPEYALPGTSRHYATVRAHRGEALGLLVESHEGRPTNIQGNPDHPATLGGADLLTQAYILDLYDPDRSTAPMHGKEASNWQEVDALFADRAKAFAADGGAKLRVLVQPTNSPTFVRLRDMVQAKYPHARIHTWTPVSESNVREGARLAFGQAVNTIYDYALARVVVSLDADFLQTEPGNIRANKSFSKGRRLGSSNDAMSRLYVVEPAYTTTGANADHRLRLPARDIERYLLALAKELSARPGIDLAGVAAAFGDAGPVDGVPEKWITVVAGELAKNRGRGVLVAGARQPARVHALVHAINYALGNSGSTVNHFPVADPTETEAVADLKALAADMDAGRVDTLVMLGVNPVYDAPVDLQFAARLAKVTTSIHLADRVDETSEKCTWHLPLAHPLESWGDQRGLDGTLSIQQPLIAPLHGGRSELEILGILAGEAPVGYALVRGSMKAGTGSALAMDAQWKAALNKGLFSGAGHRPFGSLAVKADGVGGAFAKAAPAKPLGTDNLEIAFAADAKLFDGRFANNPWLLELPDSMTKITWDNAAYFSPTTAKALGIASGDVVQIARDGVTAVEIVAWITPGHADNSITLALGWGRTKAGQYGSKVGSDVYPLRHSETLGFADGAKVTKTGRRHDVSQTQEHQSMEGRPIAIDATLEQYRATPDFAQYRSPDPKVLPLWDPVKYEGHKWGMTIDLAACTGCNACVIACQSENNIATVGKEQVARNREMHWIRIDRYFLGEDETAPAVAFQPLACVQCEDAPCENVCPVNATAHSPEGLNDMAYNRCIGTRYCANNCPYKVRRFNYLEFQGGPPGSSIDTMYGDLPETRKMQFNPNVTVRMRGVMEKCTYCVQRIQEGKIAASREQRTVKDGQIVSACAQTCPADAIVFGDLNDPNSRVARIAKTDRRYKLLAELGTHPRTTYLGKIRNPNAEMEKA